MRRITKVSLLAYLIFLTALSIFSIIRLYGNMKDTEVFKYSNIKIYLDNKKENVIKNPDESYMSPVMIGGEPYLPLESAARLTGFGVVLDDNTINFSSKKIGFDFAHFNEDEAHRMLDKFKEVYPKVNVNLKLVPNANGEYQNYLAAALKSGTHVADVFAVDSSFAKRFIELPDAFADLTDKAKGYTDKMIPYTIQVGTDKKGILRALSDTAAPGVIIYKKSISQKYLGTDDPLKIEEMFSTPEKILQTAEILKQKSNGKVCLFSSFEELMLMYMGERRKGWVTDNKLVIDEKVQDFIGFAKMLRAIRYEAGIEPLSSDWYSAIYSNDSVMAWVCPFGQISNIVGYTDIKSGQKWGVIRPAYPFYDGGTWYGIYSKSQNKEIAWEFIKYFTTGKVLMRNWANEYNSFPNNMEIISEGAKENDKFLGINRFKLFEPIVKEIDGKNATAYDHDIESEFVKALRLYLDGKFASKEEMISSFKKNVKLRFDDLVVQ
ncbi:MAG TPA: extracellular solute-binding protein [Pseudobacteroides sp.]|uniref:ABC transporter substrate-binding protein n=1 Tax=Pseudobacteroides sp. TaxID=1968840 RepID=UPI002F9488BF